MVGDRRRTADGTAVAGADYASLPPTVVAIPPGSTVVPLTVRVRGDVIDEPDETFRVQLSDPQGGSYLLDGEVIVTILDDDP